MGFREGMGRWRVPSAHSLHNPEDPIPIFLSLQTLPTKRSSEQRIESKKSQYYILSNYYNFFSIVISSPNPCLNAQLLTILRHKPSLGQTCHHFLPTTYSPCFSSGHNFSDFNLWDRRTHPEVDLVK